MNRIESMLREQCPNGVEFNELGKYCQVFSGFAFKSELFNTERNGVPLVRIRDLNSGFSSTYYSGNYDDRYIVEDGDLLIGMDGDFRPVRWRHGRALLNQRVCRLQEFSSALDPEFAYQVLKVELQRLVESTQKSTVRHLSSRQLKSLQIPLPPIQIQVELTRILAAMEELESELEAELEAEREARERQYEYYRKFLVSDGRSVRGVNTVPLGDLFEMQAGTHIPSSEIHESRDPSHPYPCFGGNGVRGYVSDFSHEGNFVLVGRQGALCGNVKRASDRFYATEHAVVLTPHPGVDRDWAFHALVEADLNQYASKSAQPGLAVGKLKTVKIHPPDKAAQEWTASKLNQFEALVNELTSGLPNEIAARRKQYEYYRDKLLTFPEATA